MNSRVLFETDIKTSYHGFKKLCFPSYSTCQIIFLYSEIEKHQTKSIRKQNVSSHMFAFSNILLTLNIAPGIIDQIISVQYLFIDAIVMVFYNIETCKCFESPFRRFGTILSYR